MAMKNMKPMHWIVVAAVLLLTVACGQRPEDVIIGAQPTPDEASDPSSTLVRPGVTILADGAVQSAQPALALAFEAGGKLLAVYVNAGDRVQAGDLIATLDDAALQEAVAAGDLQVAQSENNLAQMQLALETVLVGCHVEGLLILRIEADRARHE